LPRFLLGGFVGFLEAAGHTVESEDFGVMDEAVDEGGDTGRVWEGRDGRWHN
jgi:hypothetical protein